MKNTFGVTAVDQMKMEVDDIIQNQERSIADLNNQKTQKETAIKTLRDEINKHLEASDNHTIYLSHWISKLLRILG
jgi:vacuolar-type H+-ATPase subunit I/STV1